MFRSSCCKPIPNATVLSSMSGQATSIAVATAADDGVVIAKATLLASDDHNIESEEQQLGGPVQIMDGESTVRKSPILS